MGASETRRPRDESPFSYARVNHLQREKQDVKNQVFEVGPARRPPSAEQRANHSRGHALGRASEVHEGMPWKSPPDPSQATRKPARCNTLRNERREADQALEWVPASAKFAELDDEPLDRYHGRINMLKREEVEAGKPLDCNVAEAERRAREYHGRKNIMVREHVKYSDSVDMPVANGHELGGDAPIYARRNLLAREQAVIAAH